MIRLRYRPGEFLNALNPESAIRNENLWIGLEEDSPPHRRLVVRQIAGLIARRIVCNLRSGERVARGQQFGMIKLGSRTELIFRADEPALRVSGATSRTKSQRRQHACWRRLRRGLRACAASATGADWHDAIAFAPSPCFPPCSRWGI